MTFILSIIVSTRLWGCKTFTLSPKESSSVIKSGDSYTNKRILSSLSLSIKISCELCNGYVFMYLPCNGSNDKMISVGFNSFRFENSETIFVIIFRVKILLFAALLFSYLNVVDSIYFPKVLMLLSVRSFKSIYQRPLNSFNKYGSTSLTVSSVCVKA